jgi:hypothetical protein
MRMIESRSNKEKLDRWSAIGYSALGIMCGVWLCAGWYILLVGRFYSEPRYSQRVTYVDGAGAVCMAFLFLNLAAISSVVILERLNVRGVAGYALSAAILGLPVAYLLIANSGKTG